MLSFRETRISIYHDVTDRIGSMCSLDAFLRSERHKDLIEEIRRTTDKNLRKELKRHLPCGTVSGLFEAPRKAENLVRHSGYLCVDIDAEDNPSLGDLSIVRDILKNRPEVAYAGRSVSGTGWFAIVPLAHPDRHLSQFLAIEREYAALGIVIDPSCKDVSRLRFVSYDPDPWINPHPVEYQGLYEAPAAPSAPQRPYTLVIGGRDREENHVAICCNVIARTHIDITGGYKDWFALACSLSALGENGRQYFHIVSQQYNKYSAAECDAKFTEALNTRNRYSRNCGLGTFFQICKDYGVTFKQ